MPGLGQTIVVGGGISLTGGVVNEFLFLTSLVPPTATTTARIRRSGSDIIIESAAGRGDTVIGGSAAGSANAGASVVIGQAVTASPSAASGPGVIIGQNSTFTSTGEFVVIGHNITADGSNGVVIGHFQSKTQSLGSSTLLIGTNLVITTTGITQSAVVGVNANIQGANATGLGFSATPGSEAVAIGSSAFASTQSVVIGRLSSSGSGSQCIMIGTNTTNPANAAGVIALGGRNGAANVAANTMYLGHQDNSNNVFTDNIFLFGGPTHKNNTVVPARTLQCSNATGGNDLAAGNVTITAPRATGNAASGDFIFQVGVEGASGGALQAATDVLRLVHETTAVPVSAHARIEKDRGLRFVNQTNAAGAAAGTLLNAPVAGDPGHWLKIAVGGVNYAIPCWAG